jgi:predicted DNA repair protein MutK
MTAGVYGVVAGIVKLDDLGLHLLQSQEPGGFARLKSALGKGLLWFAPRLMKSLTLIGTLAMFLVGGGILVHGIAPIHHWMEGIHHSLAHAEGLTAWLSFAWTPLANATLGILAGFLVLAILSAGQRLWTLLRPADGNEKT